MRCAPSPRASSGSPRPERGSSIITHYQRMLDYITPDVVHVFVDGRIVETGDADLARRIEEDGYDAFAMPDRARRRARCMTATLLSADLAGRLPDPRPREMNGKPLVYLDSAATTQKPVQVLDAMDDYYRHHNANVHRGAYPLAEEATELYEGARAKVARFINAATPEEVVFTRGTTTGDQRHRLRLGPLPPRAGRPHPAHHAGAPRQRGPLAVGRPPHRRRTRLPAAHRRLPHRHRPPSTSVLDERVKIIAFSGMSNVLGTIGPIAETGRGRPERGRDHVVDAAQLVPHTAGRRRRRSVSTSSPSAPTRCSAPPGSARCGDRMERLEEMEPAEGGGEMIRDVGLHESTWADIPHKFEAGTPPIAEAIGFGAAVDYLTGDRAWTRCGRTRWRSPRYALERLAEIPDLTVYGPHDIAHAGRCGLASPSPTSTPTTWPPSSTSRASRSGPATTAPSRCMRLLDVPATARASFYVYSIPEEVDVLVAALHEARRLFGVA